MISSIFGKTKPINFIIVLSFLFLFYWVVQFLLYENVFVPEQLVIQIVILSLLLFSFFITDFIVKRNKLTGLNSFTILFFALLMIVFPETLEDNNSILCSFFILLAIRRIISIKSLKRVKFKIFDATFWILVSSLFYDWALLFLIIVFISIYIFEPKNFKNWLVPLTAVFAFGCIGYTIALALGEPNFFMDQYRFIIHWDLGIYLNWTNSTRLMVYLVIVLLMAMYSFVKLGNIGVGKIVTTRLLVFIFVIGFIVNLLLASRESHPLMLTFFPAAVLLTNYVETIQKPNIREIVLLFSVFTPIIVFLSILILK